MSNATEKIKRHTMTIGTLTPEGKVVNSMQVDIAKIQSTDPLAFSYGFYQGREGRPMGKGKDLAPEYIRGYKEGAKTMIRR